MLIGKGSNLGHVGNAQHLVGSCELPELLANDRSAAAANAHVDLVKDQSRALIDAREDGLQSQGDTSELAAARDAGEASRRLAGVSREEELGLVGASSIYGNTMSVLVGGPLDTLGLQTLLDGDFEASAGHV